MDNARALVEHHDAGDARGAVQRAAAGVCPVLGLHGRAPARRTGRGPRARTSAASATSSTTRSPGTLRQLGGAGGASRRAGCARSPICGPRHDRRGADRASSARKPPRLRPLDGRPPFQQVRELMRRVGLGTQHRTRHQHLQRAVAADRRRAVAVTVSRRAVSDPAIAACEVASHAEVAGRRQRVIEPSHYHGMPAPCAGRRRRRAAGGRSRAAAGAAAAVGGIRAGGRGRLVMAPTMPRARPTWLTRLQLTAIRDQLDSLLDEAAKQRADAARGGGPPVRARDRPPRRPARRDGEQDRALPHGPRSGRLRLRRPALARSAADPRARRLPLGGPRRCAAAAGSAWGRQDASGDRARPRRDPRGLFGAVRHRAGAGRRPGQGACRGPAGRAARRSTPSPSS